MDKLEFAIEVMVIGLSVVMVTLFLLYIILLIFNHLIPQKEKKASSLATATKLKPSLDVSSDESTLTAVVMAAVLSYLEKYGVRDIPVKITINDPATDFNIANNDWQIAGRKQLMQGKIDLETIRRNWNREKI